MSEDHVREPLNSDDYSQFLRQLYEQMRDNRSKEVGSSGLEEIKLRLFLSLIRKPEKGDLPSNIQPPGCG